jgi:hypothetical protein
MKRNMKYGLLILAVLAFAGLALAQTGYIQFDQGRQNLTVQSGGTVTVASGGILDVESGGYFKIAGTAVTSSAAELNTVDVTTAGVAEASKALVLGATKNVDTVRVQKLGMTAITAMTDTTGMVGPTIFTFTGDTLYVYKADHTVVSIQ